MGDDVTDAADEASSPDPAATPSTFQVELGDTAVIRARGEIDALTAPSLDSKLDEAFASRPRAVTVDMADVVFIDSMGLGVLVRAHQRGERDGIPLQIRNVSPACLTVFEITMLTEVLDLR